MVVGSQLCTAGTLLEEEKPRVSVTQSRYGHVHKRKISTPARNTPISQVPTSKPSD
jgi:hypothetical protein